MAREREGQRASTHRPRARQTLTHTTMIDKLRMRPCAIDKSDWSESEYVEVDVTVPFPTKVQEGGSYRTAP